MKKRNWTEWVKKVGIRAVKTMAQTAALAGVASLLTSLKGLPELESKEEGA